MPFDKDKKTYTGNCNYDEESREREREKERERARDDEDEIDEWVSYMLPKVLCIFCTFSFESLFSILKVALYA